MLLRLCIFKSNSSLSFMLWRLHRKDCLAHVLHIKSTHNVELMTLVHLVVDFSDKLVILFARFFPAKWQGPIRAPIRALLHSLVLTSTRVVRGSRRKFNEDASEYPTTTNNDVMSEELHRFRLILFHS